MSSAISRRQFVTSSIVAGAALCAAGAAALRDVADARDGQPDAASSSRDGSARAAGSSRDVAAGSASGEGSRVLVAWFSGTGNTERVAGCVAEATGADTFAITPAQPYTAEDLDYNDDASRVSAEHADEARHVELAQVTPADFARYDVVFLGFPIWWGNPSWVIDDFVSGNDFTGKTVVPFCTSASSPLPANASQQLAALVGNAGTWLDGQRFGSGAQTDEVSSWLDGLEL